MNTLSTKSQQQQQPAQWLNFEALKDAGLLAGGIGLAMYGLAKRSPLALVVGGIGAYVAARTATDWIEKAEAGGVSKALQTDHYEEVARSVTINQSASEVFGYVRDLSRVPLFLPIVKLVNLLSDTRAIWTLKKGIASVVLDVEISGSPGDDHLRLAFSHHGTELGYCHVYILPLPNLQATRVTLRMMYHPFMGGLADKVVRPVMVAELDTYLLKLKQLIETGEIARAK